MEEASKVHETREQFDKICFSQMVVQHLMINQAFRKNFQEKCDVMGRQQKIHSEVWLLALKFYCSLIIV